MHLSYRCFDPDQLFLCRFFLFRIADREHPFQIDLTAVQFVHLLLILCFSFLQLIYRTDIRVDQKLALLNILVQLRQFLPEEIMCPGDLRRRFVVADTKKEAKVPDLNTFRLSCRFMPSLPSLYHFPVNLLCCVFLRQFFSLGYDPMLFDLLRNAIQ